jgi:hypothetical protein
VLQETLNSWATRLLILCHLTTNVLRKSDKTKLLDLPHANVCRIVWVSDQNAHKVHSITHTLVVFESKPVSHALVFLHRYLLLDETLNPVQIVGAIVTLASIYLINKRTISNNDSEAKTWSEPNAAKLKRCDICTYKMPPGKWCCKLSCHGTNWSFSS